MVFKVHVRLCFCFFTSFSSRVYCSKVFERGQCKRLHKTHLGNEDVACREDGLLHVLDFCSDVFVKDGSESQHQVHGAVFQHMEAFDQLKAYEKKPHKGVKDEKMLILHGLSSLATF